MTILPADLGALVVRKVRASGSSFYWAMRMLEEGRRDAMYAIYAFCRDVDDAVDEEQEEADKRRRLDAWRADIEAVYAGRVPSQPLAVALIDPIHAYRLQQADFLGVIEGCEMDLGVGVVRPTMAVLERYCDRVAGAVGRLSVRVFGADGPSSIELAYHQGLALQLTNILRDVVVDAKIGRLYLPDELLSQHGIAGTDIDAILAHPALPEVCRTLADVARGHYAQARAAMALFPRRAMRPARIMLEMYAAIFRVCEADSWHPRAVPKSLPKVTKLWFAFRYGMVWR